MKKIVLLILIGLSFISIGTGLQIDQNKKGKILFYSKKTSNKNYKTAKINLDQIEKSTKNKEEPLIIEQVIEDPTANQEPVKIWYYPTNNGYISGGMGNRFDGFHHGYDITSPFASHETIYPIADGVITGVFTDNVGAKIITLGHNIDGVNYSSMYVHLSSYASNIYVGRNVTVNDPLGQMGTTGYSTGVHLHLEIADCLLFADDDPNCSSLSKYFKYIERRYYQGFYGAGTILNLPNSWNSR